MDIYIYIYITELSRRAQFKTAFWNSVPRHKEEHWFHFTDFTRVKCTTQLLVALMSPLMKKRVCYCSELVHQYIYIVYIYIYSIYIQYIYIYINMYVYMYIYIIYNNICIHTYIYIYIHKYIFILFFFNLQQSNLYNLR